MKKELYALDNAAILYPATATKQWNLVFGMSAILKEEVDVNQLKQAVKDLEKRFPTFYVNLYNGPSWDYLRKINDDIAVESVVKNWTNRPFNLKDKSRKLFRVVANKNKISCEFFHSLTDGTGAIIYLRSLLVRYFELKGVKVSKFDGVLRVGEDVQECEIEDAFQKIYCKKLKFERKEDHAYQLPVEILDNFLQERILSYDINKLKEISRDKYSCTITQYISAVFAKALLIEYYNDNNKSDKPVKLAIPANLRSIFDSKTIRNFSALVYINVTPQNSKHDLKEIIAILQDEMKQQINKENLHAWASKNVGAQKMFLAKITPNFFKKFVVKSGEKVLGESCCTAAVTNIGLIKFPDEISEFIDNAYMSLGKTAVNTINISALGYKNNLNINISTASKHRSVSDSFIKIIEQDGLLPKDESLDKFKQYENKTTIHVYRPPKVRPRNLT